jgi:putative transposase
VTYDPRRHHRRSIRLKGYDYSRPGAYFITIVAQDRACLFGEVVDGAMHLSEVGQIVSESWQWLAAQYEYVRLDAWVVMPNHLHGIIVITDRGMGGGDSGRGGSRTAPTAAITLPPTAMPPSTADDPPVDTPTDAPAPVKRKTIGRLVGAFKTVSTKRINEYRGTPGAVV